MGGDVGLPRSKEDDETLRATLLNKNKSCEKSYFEVLRICCSSEVPFIEGILKPLEGVEDVLVIVTSKTVVVFHDSHVISASQIAKVLNQARLEASIKSNGGEEVLVTWPSPYIIASGILLVVSLFKTLYDPLRWFAVGAVVVGLPPILMKSVTSIRRLVVDINILMIIAACGAVALGDYLEAGFIVFLFTIAEWLENLARRKAAVGMTSIMSMVPQKAILAKTGDEVDAREVTIDSLIAVMAGEIIPIDGVVVEGRSDVDESSLTGESFPVPKQAGSRVLAGTFNIDGYLCVRTTAMVENSAVVRMGRLVEEAQSNQSNTQRLIDTCAKYYLPLVLVVSAGVAVVPLIFNMHNPEHAFRLALVLLVGACPCALVLSTPIATFCALLKAAQMGLLVKGGDVVETLLQVKAAAFDKTGTITRGEFTVREFHVLNSDISFQTVLYWVSSIESKSSHPMASALVNYARSNSVEPKADDVLEFLIFPGEGVFGRIDGQDIYVGNRRIVERATSQKVPSMEAMEGVSVGYVVHGRQLISFFTLSDSCRTGSEEAIRQIKSLGIRSVMLTGDTAPAANFAQNQLNSALDEIHSELLPADKVRVINEIKSCVGPTMMVGDGMNDAPALASADVSISMGVSGSAIATETSDITLMSNDLKKIPQAVRLAKRTHQTILANIIFSVASKTVVLCLAFVGHPILWAAVLADVGTCLLVILNSMMLLREKNTKVNNDKYCSAKLPSCCNSEAFVTSYQDQASKTKPNPCQSGCCDKPTKEKGNYTSQDNSHPHFNSLSEKHSDNFKEEKNGKGSSCQGQNKKCNDEIKKKTPETRATGGCCSKSYEEEVARREGCGNGCCGNGIVKFPKIITE